MINSNEVKARKQELDAVLKLIANHPPNELKLILQAKIDAYDALLRSEFIEQVKAPGKVLGNSREFEEELAKVRFREVADELFTNDDTSQAAKEMKKEYIKRVTVFSSKNIKQLQSRMADSLYVNASLGKECLILVDERPNDYLKLIQYLLTEMNLKLSDVENNIRILRLEHLEQVNIASKDCFFIFSSVDSLSEMARYRDFKESVKSHAHNPKSTKPVYEFRDSQQIYLMHCTDSVWKYGDNVLDKMHVINLD
jgi:hypothetical protein